VAHDLRDPHRVPPPRPSARSPYVGAALVAAISISTWWVPDLRSTLLAAGPWLAVLAIGYLASKRRAAVDAGER